MNFSQRCQLKQTEEDRDAREMSLLVFTDRKTFENIRSDEVIVAVNGVSELN